MGIVNINGLRLYAFHGVDLRESQDGQDFLLNVSYSYNMDRIGISDNIDEGVNYAEVVETVKKYFCSNTYKTLERVAYVVADSLLRTYPDIDDVRIEILKPDAPLRAEFGSAGIVIEKARIRKRVRK